MEKKITVILVTIVAIIAFVSVMAFYHQARISEGYSRTAPAGGYGDINGDGVINFGVQADDPFLAYNFFKQYITPDVNHDGIVNNADTNLVTSQWGKSGSSYWIPEDVDLSGHIDARDLYYISVFWNRTECQPSTQDRINQLNLVPGVNITFDTHELTRRIDVDNNSMLSFNDVLLIEEYAKGEINEFPVEHITNHPPVAVLDKNRYTGAVGEPVTFDASGSYDPDGDTIQYRWAMFSIDGYYTDWTTNSTFTYTFSLPLKNVQLYLHVKDSHGAESVTNARIFIYENITPPVADFTYTPANPKVGDVVYLNSTSYDPDGYITDYYWYIDGKTAPYYWHKDITYIFNSSGNHVVKLTVGDNDHLVTSKTKTIVVGQPQPPPTPPARSKMTNAIMVVALVGFIGTSLVWWKYERYKH